MIATSWGEICTLEYGKSLRDYPAEQSETDCFRVFGTNGPIGWTAQKLSDDSGIIVGRKGAYRGIHYSPEPFFVIDTAYYLRPKDARLDLRWAYYKLLTVNLDQVDVGAAIPTTNRDAFYALPVSIPERGVQRKLASVLVAYDDAIENNRRRIGLLEKTARLLYEEWFVRLRFPGHGHVSATSGIPDGWERLNLGTVLTLQRGHDLPTQDRTEGEIPIVSSSGITGFHNMKKADAPGVVTGRYGTIGQVYYIDRDYWPLNTSLYVVDFKGNPSLFIHHLLSRTLGTIQSDKAAVPGVNRNVLHAIEVLSPSRRLRESFAEIVEPMYRQISLLRTHSEKLRAARDLLLPRLMNGEIEV
jgi:type I restriction enzyme, S subunit